MASEAESVESFRATGDNRHFEALYRSLRSRVFGVCCKLLRNPEAAEDATHEAFIKAYEQFSSLKGNNFAAWVVRIASNLCLNRIRDEYTSRRLLSGAGAAQELDGERAAIEAAQAQEVLGSLGPAQRKVLLLKYLDGHSYEEIGRITGYDEDQVRSHLQNGRRNFRLRWVERVKHGFGRV